MDIEAFDFTPKMEIGIPAIDAQHREYFNRLNKLLDLCRRESDFAEIMNVFEFFQVYAVEHFDSEEFLMREEGYPLYAEQQQYHAYFCSKLEELLMAIQKEGEISPKNLEKLVSLTVNWFVDHIQKHDIKIAKHIASLSK